MKKILALVIAVGLLLMPIAINAQTEETAANPPPVGQVLIPEGDFALKLASALKLGTPSGETEAESMLAAVGIAPKNGWIADYPMTPIIIGEVENTVVAAAAAEKLAMGSDEAIKTFQDLTTEFSLSVAQGTGEFGESQPPTSSEYIPPTAVNDYYYSEGPPVVTYYPPPWDYDYLYAWVPYPFWYTGFFFPGFFILNDFDVTVVSRGHYHHHQITNHFIDPQTRRVHLVDPGANRIGTSATNSLSRTRGFNSPEARRGATSIFERDHQTQRQVEPGNVSRGLDNRGFGQSNSPGRRSDTREGRTFNTPSGEIGRSFAPSPNFSGSRIDRGPSQSPRGSIASPGRAFSSPRGFSGESHGGSMGHGGHGFPSGFSSGAGLSRGGNLSHGGSCRGRC